MLFSSMIFIWLFLPVVFFVYRVLSRKYQNLFLLLASLLFYGWGEPKRISIMLVSIVINYISGVLIADTASKPRKRIILALNILANLGILCYFKYMTPSLLAIDKLISLEFKIPIILLPIGISFFTFQALSYVIDVYRGTIKVQRNPFDLALYISFFPQLVAGPIVKYHDINLQLRNRALTSNGTAYGIKRFIYGLAKKVLIANQMAIIADDIFAISGSRLDTPIAWIGILAYSLQIYFDFSGYSDMAIGLGRMFGFRFLENFNYPYISRSVQEFWRRWHISLSTWFKEYLYFPLGGSRGTMKKTCINVMIVFTATGIWHGAGLNFVVWGVYYGIFLVLERIWLKEKLDKPGMRVLSHIYLLFIVIVGWVFFRADNLPAALTYLKAMFNFTLNPDIPFSHVVTPYTLLIMGAAIVFCGPVQEMIPSLKRLLYTEKGVRYFEIPILISLFLCCILMLSGDTYNPFIYFRF